MPVRRSRSTTSAACSRTLTAGAWMWCSDTSSTVLGSSALAASAANCSSPIPISTSGSNVANRSSSPTARGCRRLSAASRRSKVPATCLNALYCSSRAKSRSRASSSARSSSSSTSPCGSSRAALRSRRVEAMSRNDVVCSRSQTGPPAFTKAMNSSVTVASATSVMSSLCLEIRLSSRSKGPSKLSSRTANAGGRVGVGRERRRRPAHSSVSRRTRTLSSPCASKSASTSARASRTRRPRSTASPCSPRSWSRACSRWSSSAEVT